MRLFSFLLLLIPYSVDAQLDLFNLNSSTEVIATKDHNRTQGLFLDKQNERYLLDNRPSNDTLILPFFGDILSLPIQRMQIHTNDFQIISISDDGIEFTEETPTILTYELFYKDNSIGVLNLFDGLINATFKYNNRQYEIGFFKEEYILFEASNSINSSSFSCVLAEKAKDSYSGYVESSSNTPVCIELAIEIDNYTRQTFSSNIQTINWALAIVAGVSQIYDANTNAAIQVTYSYVWNTTDPYSAYTSQASNMLSELRNYWNTNNAAIPRDLVHLLTKRNNTGTGGIAYRDVLCSNSWGYGFSASLNNDTTYSFPNPSYTWNLNVVSHELGHNVGSRHTHWCGWAADPFYSFAGGPIDNCVDVEGSCSNSPAPQLGTIMSYCHTTSAGVVLDFHEIVISQALDPGILNASCLTTCSFYGCTDTTAFNFDPNATVDDGSCIPIVLGCTDPLAANFNPLANTNDSTCTYCSAISFNNTNISCSGSLDGSVDLLVQNGTPPFTYSWIGPNGFSSSSEDITGLEQGTYTVVVTDGLGCSETSSTTISDPLPIILNSTQTTDVSCNALNDGSVSFNLTGGTPPYYYNWGVLNPNALPAGSYNISITDVNNCPSVNSSFVISEPMQIVISNVSSDVSCNGANDGSIDITVNGGSQPFTFNWSGPNTFSSVFEDISLLSPGIYSLDITDVNGCVETEIVTITEPAVLSASSSSNHVSCNGGSDGIIDLTTVGGTFPYNFIWNNLTITEDLTNVSAGNYSVNVSDANGCVLPTMYFTLTEPPASSVVEQINSVDCYGNSTGSVDVSYIPASGINQTSYLWSGPNGFSSTMEDINNLFSGIYILDITENNNCVTTFSYLVTEPNLLTVQEQIQQVSCFGGSDADVTLYINGGTPAYSIDWYNQNPQQLSAGSYDYMIIDQNYCSYTNTVVITQPQNPLSTVVNTTDVSCYNGNDGSAILTINGGTPSYTINWQNALSNQLSSGYHRYTVVDGNSCILEDSVYIAQPSPIIVSEQVSDVLCFGSDNGSVNLQISGGVPSYTTDWLGFNNLSLYAGSYLYTVTDANSCIFSSIVTVNQPNNITVINSITPSTCPNVPDGSVFIDSIYGGVPPYITNWGSYNSQSLSPGFYVYQIVDSNGCIDTNQVLVTSQSDMNVNSIISPVTCSDFCDGSVNLNVSNGIPPYIINWNGFSSDSLCVGDYVYDITDALGCVFLDSVAIINTLPIDLVINQQSSILEAIVTGGSSPYSFIWWDMNGTIGNSQFISVNQPGNYYCVVFDINNCNSDTVSFYFSETLVLDSNNDELKIYPNPFNLNTTIELPERKDFISLKLYNLIGSLAFEDNYNNIQKIYLNRNNLESGSYYLFLEYDQSIFWHKLIVY